MEELSAKFGAFCRENGIVIATAESCTAGLISATIAMTPGSSAWLDRGFTVYTAKAKTEMLDVKPDTISTFDITSKEVAIEMAEGAIRYSDANVSLAVTGLAGPSGGTDAIPVGTVCMAWAFKKKGRVIPIFFAEKIVFDGTRNDVRTAVAQHMIEQTMVLHAKLSTKS